MNFNYKIHVSNGIMCIITRVIKVDITCIVGYEWDMTLISPILQ